MKLICTLLFVLFLQDNFAQKQNAVVNTSLPTPKAPTGPVVPNPQYNLLNSTEDIQRRNMQLIEQDIREYEIQKQKEAELLQSAYKQLGVDENSGRASTINYSMPENRSSGKSNFEKAYDEIKAMVEGRKPYSLKRAVFLTESAFDTTLNYSQFERQISKIVEVIMLEMKRTGIRPDDNIGKIMSAYKFMADTIRVKHPVTERNITTYPKTYDFEDFYGMTDYRKMFVSKLIKNGKGQCHSLPLLFLILCEELNAKAYLSYAPEHSYVKFKDKYGNLQNIELTNQMFTSDQFILQSGYINSAAIKNRTYMDTVNRKTVVLHTLNDLANNYVRKYRYDDFVLKCARTVNVADPRNIHSKMHLANYYNILGRNIEKQYAMRGLNFKDVVNKDTLFTNVVSKAVDYGKQLEEMGYAEMPSEMYAKWLNSLKNESLKQQHLERKRVLSTMIEY